MTARKYNCSFCDPEKGLPNRVKKPSMPCEDESCQQAWVSYALEVLNKLFQRAGSSYYTAPDMLIDQLRREPRNKIYKIDPHKLPQEQQFIQENRHKDVDYSNEKFSYHCSCGVEVTRKGEKCIFCTKKEQIEQNGIQLRQEGVWDLTKGFHHSLQGLDQLRNEHPGLFEELPEVRTPETPLKGWVIPVIDPGELPRWKPGPSLGFRLRLRTEDLRQEPFRSRLGYESAAEPEGPHPDDDLIRRPLHWGEEPDNDA